MNIIALVCNEDPSEYPNLLEGARHDRYSSLDDLIKEGKPYNVIILANQTEPGGSSIKKLRAIERYQLSIIYSTTTQTAYDIALSDGIPPNNPISLTKISERHKDRIGLFNRGNPPNDLEERIVSWLWTRPEREIIPTLDSLHRNFYRYPLVEILLQDGETNGRSVCTRIEAKQLIQKGSLIDRVRGCSRCDSSRLNYVDTCPECQSIEIGREASLHCFICGHVAPQEEFTSGGLLRCKNCLTQLRHIGSDYDRPIENYRCRSCNAFFEDAEVKAKCCDCGKIEEPSNLRVIEYYTYKLSENGLLACRQGLKPNDILQGYYANLKLVSRQEFVSAIDWHTAIVKRYGGERGDIKCSILGIRFNNTKDLLDNLGEARTSTILENVVSRIEEMVRDTDRCMQGDEITLWVLLPQTNREGVKMLSKRLQRDIDKITNEEHEKLDLSFAEYELCENPNDDHDAAVVLSRAAEMLVEGNRIN